MIMKLNFLSNAAIALVLSAGSLSAFADPSISMMGDPMATSAASSRTIEIHPDTQYVNVSRGDTVKFNVGNKSFSWNFDGPITTPSFDLNQIAPNGVLDHTVRAYVSAHPRQN